MSYRLYLERFITLLILFSTILFIISFMIDLEGNDYKITLMIVPIFLGIVLIIYYSLHHINYQVKPSPKSDREVWFRWVSSTKK